METHDIDYYLGLPYHIEIIRDTNAEDPGWVAAVTELPGCLTQADTFEELGEQIEDAQRAWIETALEENIPIPEPRAEEGYSGRFVLRTPRSLHRKLADQAEKEGVSLNTLCSTLLAEGLGERRAASAQTREEPTFETSVGPHSSANWEQLCKVVKAPIKPDRSMEDNFTGWLRLKLDQINGLVQNNNPTDAMKIGYHLSETLREHAPSGSVVSIIAALFDLIQALPASRPGGRASAQSQVEEGLRQTIIEVNVIERKDSPSVYQTPLSAIQYQAAPAQAENWLVSDSARSRPKNP